MQVKKFEAATMKEALEMVKVHLGPDAVILSAKDLRKGFGLMARESVEVTAAISEMQLRKREVAESKLSEIKRTEFRSKPARMQKEFIERSQQKRATPADLYFEEAQEEQATKNESQQRGNLRYADIEDEDIPPLRRGFSSLPESIGQQVARVAQERLQKAYPKAKPPVETAAERSSERVRSAARTAAAASAAIFANESKMQAEEFALAAAAPVVSPDVSVLKEEIRQLQDVIRTLKEPKPSPMAGLSLHPGAEHGLPFELSSIYEKMIGSGLAPNVMMNILSQLRETMDPEQMKRRGLVEAWVARYILDHTQTLARPADGRVHIFVGPSGSGKTATLVKMASHLLIHERRNVAILSADTFKVGAVDQLRIYAQILNVPFGLIRAREDWDELLNQLSGYDAILVDFPGTALRTLEDIDVFKSLLPPTHIPSRMHYVQSCGARDPDAFELARRYQLADFKDVIFTSLDEASTHGLIFNFQQQFKVPLHSFGLGRMIPEDFEWATRERMVDLIFKITKLKPTPERGVDFQNEVGK